MSNFCFFTLGFLGTAMHSHACTTHLWHGLPSSQANLALIQFAQAFLIPLGMWLINNRLQVLVVMICGNCRGDREFTPDTNQKNRFCGALRKADQKKTSFRTSGRTFWRLLVYNPISPSISSLFLHLISVSSTPSHCFYPIVIFSVPFIDGMNNKPTHGWAQP